MRWEIFPKNEKLTTTLPMSLEIYEWKEQPHVYLEGVGELVLKGDGGKLKTDFYFIAPGRYQLTVQDGLVIEQRVLDIEEHQYLSFTNEFGFFLLLFLFVMGGIVLWTKKIMLK